MPVVELLYRPIHTRLSSISPSTSSVRTTTLPISNWTRLYGFQAHPVFLNSPIKPIYEFQPFSLCNSQSRFISRARVFNEPVNLEKHEEEETIDLFEWKVLKQKIESFGIECDFYTPGQYTRLICPKCKGGQSMERSLSFHIKQNEEFAMWRCFRFECGWSGKVFADTRHTHNGVNTVSEVNSYRQMTEETLQLEPLGDELIAYFAERNISKEVLLKNAVMQTSDDKNVIAFPYRRHGELVNCKYRSIVNKRFWQEKRAERILYGLDGIKEADEIIIVEGEMDKLSMEQAGIFNCVSVPDGAPQKVSKKVLPSLEQDTRFKYLWNCKEYLEKASRIILATDSDIPGQALAEELARRLGKERCWVVTWPKKDELSCFKDANEVLVNLGADALRDIIDNAELYQAQNLKTAT